MWVELTKVPFSIGVMDTLPVYTGGAMYPLFDSQRLLHSYMRSATYVASRKEDIISSPFGQATISSLFAIVVPRSRPAHPEPLVMGATCDSLACALFSASSM